MKKVIMKHNGVGMYKIYSERKRHFRKNAVIRCSLLLSIRYDMLERCPEYRFDKIRKKPVDRHMDKVVFDRRLDNFLRKGAYGEKVL